MTMIRQRKGGAAAIRQMLLIAGMLAIYLWFSVPAQAAVILDDGFVNTDLVDQSGTTARVDTVNHRVVLPRQSLAGSLSMMEYGIGYAVASASGIALYEYDDATGVMTENIDYSCPWVTDATGVSLRQDNLNIWAITSDSLAYYRFDGAGMSNDPALKVSGLKNVLSVAAFKRQDSALLLENAGNRPRITRYDAVSGLTPALVFCPAVSEPVSVAMVDHSPDFRLFTKTAVYYFMYDEAGNTYIEDPAQRITGLHQVVSGSSDEVGNSILTGGDLSYYINDIAGGAGRVDVYSPGPVEGPVSVSLRPGTYDQILLNQAGDVEWWCHDDAAGRMVREPGLEVSGLSLNSGYFHPGEYYSTILNTATDYDAVRLTVSEDKPAGTSVGYFISSDGGNSFVSVAPGVWTAVPRGSRFVLKAVLDTADPRETPGILHVTLEADEDLTLEGSISPNPAERGREVTISVRAVSRTAGSVKALDSCTARYPLETRADGEPALSEGRLPAEVAMTYQEVSGAWQHTFTLPEKSVEGRWPDDGVYLVGITGMSGTHPKKLTLSLEISGNILGRLIIRTIRW